MEQQIYEIPIFNFEQLKYYWKLDYNKKGKLIESIGTQFMHLYSFKTREITSKMLQKTQGDSVVNINIPDLLQKQITVDYKAGGHSKGYNDLCIDIQYFTKEGTPYLNGGTNIGWLFTTMSDYIIAVVPKSKKLFYINWSNALQKELIRAYSLWCDGIEQLPSWVVMDTITIDRMKNTQVLRINLDKLLECYPQYINDYSIISMEQHFQQLEQIL